MGIFCVGETMNKIMVIGCPGSGKSTFARTLHEITGIPLVHMDMLFWNADRTIVEKTVFMERLENVIEENAWIIDGDYHSTMEMRLQACDTIFFLDYPLDVCLKGIEERRGTVRTDMPWVELEEDLEFVQFIKNYNVHNRPKVMALLEKYHHKDIFIFKSRAEAGEFLKYIQ